MQDPVDSDVAKAPNMELASIAVIKVVLQSDAIACDQMVRYCNVSTGVFVLCLCLCCDGSAKREENSSSTTVTTIKM